MPVHAAHLRAELGLPLPDHLLRVLLLEQVHETHGERAAGARDCVDVPPKNDVSAEGKETLTGRLARLDRPEIWLSVFEVGSERTARSSVFRVSQPVQHAGAHSRGSAGELAIPHAARRAPESSDPARAAPLRGRTPRTLKYPLPSGICCPSDAGGPDFDRRAEADARNPDPSHSRPQAIQAAKGHIHLKGSSMVSSRAPRSHPRPRGNRSTGPLHTGLPSTLDNKSLRR